jgi:hypothetical protein
MPQTAAAAATRATEACDRHTARARAAVLSACRAQANGYGVYADRWGTDAQICAAIAEPQHARTAIAAAAIDWPARADYHQAERDNAERNRAESGE